MGFGSPTYELTSTSELPAPRLSEVESFGVSYLTDEALFRACGTRIAFTLRTGGVSQGPYEGLNLGSHVGDDPAAVAENRRMLCEALGGGTHLADLAVPNQVHGEHIACLAGLEGADALPDEVADELAQGCDAIVCLDARRPVALCFADCTPVIIVAPTGAFAVAHAGWRGAIASLPGKAAADLAAKAGVDVASLNAYVGPHIGACCYEVSQELLDRFVARFGPECDAGERHLSLSAAVFASLIEAGVDSARITDVLSDPTGFGCTQCAFTRYYSYRASGGVTGRHSAAACAIR